jgi:hypothetical protein
MKTHFDIYIQGEHEKRYQTFFPISLSFRDIRHFVFSLKYTTFP